MNKNKTHFTTGEFAKLCNVSKHTLFHYDEIGVFSPDIITKNGYRYYSAIQYDTFWTIVSLQELGMSLKEIKNFLDTRSPIKLVDLLKIQEDKIDKQIQHLQSLKTILQSKRLSIDEAMHSDTDLVFIQEQSEERLLLAHSMIEADDYDMTLYISDLVNTSNRQDLEFYNLLGIIRLRSDIEQAKFNDFGRFYLKILNSSHNAETTTKPAGKYLTTYHKGPFSNISIAYERILNYANQNNINLSDIFYEESVIDDLCSPNPNDFATKVMIKI